MPPRNLFVSFSRIIRTSRTSGWDYKQESIPMDCFWKKSRIWSSDVVRLSCPKNTVYKS